MEDTMEDTNATTNENLTTVNNEPIISADDNAQAAPANSAGVTAPEDTPDASEVIIASQRQQIEVLTAHIESLNEQIAHIIRTGGTIGTPQTGIPADTGNGANPEPPAPDFAAIAKGLIL